jgi:hypothetical protein
VINIIRKREFSRKLCKGAISACSVTPRAAHRKARKCVLEIRTRLHPQHFNCCVANLQRSGSRFTPLVLDPNEKFLSVGSNSFNLLCGAYSEVKVTLEKSKIDLHQLSNCRPGFDFLTKRHLIRFGTSWAN